jgi:hypothetical protein
MALPQNLALVHTDDCDRVFDVREITRHCCEAEIYCAEHVRWKFAIGGSWAYLCGHHWDQLPSAQWCECPAHAIREE